MNRAQTIPEALFSTAERDAGEFVFHLGDGPVSVSCAELAERAGRAARRLTALGVELGDRIGILGPNRPEWAVWAFATWIAGAVLVPIQIPLRVRDVGAFTAQVHRLVVAAECRRVVADPALLSLLPDEIALSWEENGSVTAGEPCGPAPDSPAVVQFSSGSTALPKGALLTHAAVMAQVVDVLRIYRLDDDTPRTILSWAPFFHDLGLFANLVQPVSSGATVHQLPTELFARDPAEWLRLVPVTRASLTVGPSSAFGSALRAVSRRRERPDLSSLEVAYFAAEGVDPEIAQRMIEVADRFGLDRGALGSTYGLAEAVMAVAYSRAGTGLRLDRISRQGLGSSSVAEPADAGPTRVLASCGPPLMDLRIAGPEGRLAERRVGEIQVRGESLMSRYVGDAAAVPFVDDGWLCTGDLGYLAGDELYVTGRSKDVIVTMGQNYYPEDFEWAASRIDGVRPGRCVAFSVPEAEEVVLLVEAADDASPKSLERTVGLGVAHTVGVAPSEVIVLPPGTVQKTTSGKLRRGAMRDAYLGGTLVGAAR